MKNLVTAIINDKNKVNQLAPANIAIFQAKVRKGVEERNVKSRSRQERDYKSALDNGFNFLPPREIKAKYGLLNSKKERMLFILEHLTAYKKAYAYYLQYDNILLSETEAVLKFLNSEFTKLEEPVNNEGEPGNTLKNIPILRNCMIKFNIVDKSGRYLLADKGNTKMLGKIEALIAAIRYNHEYHHNSPNDDDIRKALSSIIKVALTRGKKESKCYNEEYPKIAQFLKDNQPK